MLRARASAAVRTCRVGFEACPLTQVLCLSINFYVRLLVRVYTSPVAVRDAASKQMYVFQSQGCDSFFTQRVGRKARPPPCPSPSTVVGDSLSAVQHAVHCAAALHMRSMCAVRAVKGKGGGLARPCLGGHHSRCRPRGRLSQRRARARCGRRGAGLHMALWSRV